MVNDLDSSKAMIVNGFENGVSQRDQKRRVQYLFASSKSGRWMARSMARKNTALYLLRSLDPMGPSQWTSLMLMDRETNDRADDFSSMESAS